MRVYSSKDLGGLVRQRRKNKGWTQVQLAEQVGVSRDWIIRMEQGKGRVELGLVLRTLKALSLIVSIQPQEKVAGDSDLPFNLAEILDPGKSV